MHSVRILQLQLTFNRSEDGVQCVLLIRLFRTEDRRHATNAVHLLHELLVLGPAYLRWREVHLTADEFNYLTQ
jgi:hypothetical protein